MDWSVVFSLTHNPDNIGFGVLREILMSHWSKSLVGIAVLCASTGMVVAQNNLVDLAATNPNGFVTAVQKSLKSEGIFSGDINGILDQQTISAINVACRKAGVLADCQIGPLSSVGAAAVTRALNDVSPDAVPAEPTVAPKPIDAASSGVNNPKAAAVGTRAETSDIVWKTASERNGIKVEVGIAGDVSVASITGVAVADDWTNVEPVRRIPASPGERQTFSLFASAELSAGATATAHIAAYGADNRYIGELSTAVPIEVGQSRSYTIGGVAPEGTLYVMPYIQLRYKAGTSASDEVNIADAFIN